MGNWNSFHRRAKILSQSHDACEISIYHQYLPIFGRFLDLNLRLNSFNLPPDDKGFDELLALEGMMAVNAEVPTSIKDRLYDNIWFQSQFTKEYQGQFGVFKFDEDLYGNDDKAASLAVSDHRPLWAIFDISRDDD